VGARRIGGLADRQAGGRGGVIFFDSADVHNGGQNLYRPDLDFRVVAELAAERGARRAEAAALLVAR
jgi:hypothetical protein